MNTLLNRSRAAHLAAFLLYLLTAILITYPAVTTLSTRLIGHPFADSYEYVRHIWWMNRAIVSGEPIFYQPLLAYPDGMPGGWLWGNPLQSFPSWLLAYLMPVTAAFNLSFLLTLALNGTAMYWLIWKLTGERAAALLAGLVFLAFPTFQGHIAAGHIGLLSLYPAPLFVYGLTRLRDPDLEHVRRWVLLTAVFFMMVPWGSVLMTAYLLLPISVLFGLTALLRGEWVVVRRTLLAGVIGGVLSLAFLMPVVLDQLAVPESAQEEGSVRYSADVLGVVTPSFMHPFFGQFDYTGRVNGTEPFERSAYVGVVAALLVVLALWRQRGARRWLWLAVAAWVLSLGPLLVAFNEPVIVQLDNYETFVPMPWALLMDLPVLNIARTPARFNFALALAVAVMVGYGAAALWQLLKRPRVAAVLFAVLGAVVLWEYQLFWGMYTVPGTVPEPIAAISERDDVRAVLNVPWEHLLVAKEALYLQMGHEKPLVAGHVTRRTPVDPAKLYILQEWLDPGHLDAAGVDVIIFHKDWAEDDGALEATLRDRLDEPFYEDERFIAFNAPEGTGGGDYMAIMQFNDTLRQWGRAYFYAPEPGWAWLEGTLSSRGGREVVLRLDGEPLHRWSLDGEARVDVPLYVDAGYHTVYVNLEPTCPEIDADLRALECRTVDYTDGDRSMNVFVGTDANGATFERGVTLESALVPASARESVDVWLTWQFDEGVSEDDVRFVHVVDADGELVAQVDAPMGEREAGMRWAETVSVPLDDVPPGEYTVYAGWYTFPHLTRFCVTEGGVCAGDAALLGSFERR